MRQLEDRIQVLTKNLQEFQSTMTKRLQQETNKPGFSGGGGGGGGGGAGGGAGGGRNPADAAQPEIKDTIHSIQTKLDQLDNRTQVSLRMVVDQNHCSDTMFIYLFSVNSFQPESNEHHLSQTNIKH